MKPLISRMTRISMMFLLAGLVLLPVGCGYSSKPLYRISVKTVSVPIFRNNTYNRDWEFRLTEAICKNIEYRTPYKIAQGERADTELTGEISSIDQDVLTRRFNLNLPRESQVTVAVNFQWKDLRTGRILVKRVSFSRSATGIPQIGERMNDATQLAVERLAEAIVEQLQTEF